MKCQQCSTDAPAETDPESGRLRCPRCHAFLGTGTTQTAAVRHARDILQKWSTADLLDQISSFPQVPPLVDPVGSHSTDQSDAVASSREHDQPASDSSIEQADRSEIENTSMHRDPDDQPDDAPEAAEILSLPAAPNDIDRSSEGTQQPEVSEPEDLPRLSILRADESASSEDQGDDQQSDEMVPPTLAESNETTQSKSNRSRRLTRPTVKRRVSRPVDPDSDSTTRESRTAEQGMDAVKKHLRVDRPGPHAPASDMTNGTDEPAPADPRAQDASTTRRFRIDAPAGVQELTDGSGRVRSHSRPHSRYIDEAHETAGLRGPHFEVAAPGRSSLTSLTGQFLAYIGVLGLTIGTAIVIYGHFGGMSEYTPTGWLVTTVAQMLLFLGVINLVSGGIEQNNIDVSRRINVLGEQLMRIEQVTESAMRGPRIPVERYAGIKTDEEVGEREEVYVDERR